MRDKVYEVSRKSLLDRMKARQSECAKSHASLACKDTSYANSIAAMRDIYTDIVAVIEATPDA